MKLSTDLQQVLQRLEEGGVLLPDQDRLPAIYACLPIPRNTLQTAPVSMTPAKLFNYPEGPFVRFIVVIRDDAQHPYFFEIFIDPTEPLHRESLEATAYCNTLRFHAFGSPPGLPHLDSRILKWPEKHQEISRLILEETLDAECNFIAARNRYCFQNPIPGYDGHFPIDLDE